MAKAFYELETGNLEHGVYPVNYTTENATYKGFLFTYTTGPQNRYGLGYFWGGG